jgi:HAD superfamily hydrolase (TIGR01484 family)
MKKLIAFDLDDTLAVTKSPMSDRMSDLLGQLLDHFEICVISGGKFEQFEKQVISRLPEQSNQSKLHIMPTCGTRYYRYDQGSNAWKIIYSEDLEPTEKASIIKTVEKHTKAMKLWPSDPYGEVIEDRGSQVSISMLGQLAPAEKKYEWAEKYSDKRMELRAAIADDLPQFEVRAGGSTTIDITRLGIDKAYGMKKLMEELGLKKSDILFIGDKLEEGGNDYPVKAMGIDSLEVPHDTETARVIQGILHVLS